MRLGRRVFEEIGIETYSGSFEVRAQGSTLTGTFTAVACAKSPERSGEAASG